MKFSEFICFEAICTDLEAMDKEGAIREIMKSLQDAGAVDPKDFEDIVRAILEREKLGSTAIGRGLSIPHAKYPKAKRFLGTVALSRRGIEFASLDGEKVHLILLFIAPADNPADFGRRLEKLSRHLRDEVFCRSLKMAKTSAEIRQLLEEADQKNFAAV